VTQNAWLQIGPTLALACAISMPVGRYLARVFTGRKTLADPLFDPIDNAIYVLIGRAITRRIN
jgi:potassium-transporting ATPase potassium-binding subunit